MKRTEHDWYKLECEYLTDDERKWLAKDPTKRRELVLFTLQQARRDEKYNKMTENSKEKPEKISPTYA